MRKGIGDLGKRSDMYYKGATLSRKNLRCDFLKLREVVLSVVRINII